MDSTWNGHIFHMYIIQRPISYLNLHEIYSIYQFIEGIFNFLFGSIFHGLPCVKNLVPLRTWLTVIFYYIFSCFPNIFRSNWYCYNIKKSTNNSFSAGRREYNRLYLIIFLIENDTSIEEKENYTKKHNKKEKYKCVVSNSTQQ